MGISAPGRSDFPEVVVSGRRGLLKRPFMTAPAGRRWLGIAFGFALSGCLPSEEPPLSYAGPPPPYSNSKCGRLLPLLVVSDSGHRGGAKTIFGQAGERPLLFLTGLTIVADGAPNAYHPDDVSGLDALANARGENGWRGIATDRFGRPFVQNEMDPNPGFYVSTTSLTDPDIADAADPARYVDATRVPYIALPGGERARETYAGAGVHLGDLAIVYNIRSQTIVPAVFADYAPSSSLGDGSIKLAERLGYLETSPRRGGTSEPENLTLVFPGSGAGFPRDPEHMERTTRALVDEWGGEPRLEDCAAMLR